MRTPSFRPRSRPWLTLAIAVALTPLLSGCDPMGDLQKKLMGQPSLPVITRITPPGGKAGTSITVLGSNFGGQTGAFGFVDRLTGRAVTATVTTWADATIVASVPPMDTTTGDAPVGLRTAAGAVPTGPYPFTIRPP